MKYSTYKNPLYERYKFVRHLARKNNQYIHPEWINWYGFAKWCEDRGYDETYNFSYSPRNPFTPDYIGTTRTEDRDCEYIAYEASDPYELIIASAPYTDELSAILKRMGYDYTTESIWSALSRNEEERPIEERKRGLLFEKIDLSNYDDTDEPFEER